MKRLLAAACLVIVACSSSPATAGEEEQPRSLMKSFDEGESSEVHALYTFCDEQYGNLVYVIEGYDGVAIDVIDDECLR